MINNYIFYAIGVLFLLISLFFIIKYIFKKNLYASDFYINLVKEFIKYANSIKSYDIFPEKDLYYAFKKDIGQHKRAIKKLGKNKKYNEYRDELLSIDSIYKELFQKKEYDEIIHEYIDYSINQNKDLLDNIDGKSLDMQQREAVVVEEKNSLVIAGAGSGKTLTIAGKVKYLCTVKNISPSEILLITFTKKAAEEMSERVVNRLGVNVNVKTFHSLGYDIVGEISGNKPSVYENDERIYNDFLEYISVTNTQTGYDFLEYIALYVKTDDTDKNFKDIGEYFSLLKSIDTETIKSKINHCSNIEKSNIDNDIDDSSDIIKEKKKYLYKNLITFKKEQVKSLEEVIIANYLFNNSVDYEYESDYQHKTVSSTKRQYKPDFYLPKHNIYIEHFGVNENGECTHYTPIENKKYMEGMEWKRNIHKVYGTILEETYSYEYRNNTLFKKLNEILDRHNIERKRIDKNDLNKYLIGLKTDDDFKEFYKLLKTFLTLFKAKNYKKDDIKDLKDYSLSLINKNNSYMKKKQSLFFSIFEDYYDFYQSVLEKRKEIDFNDMINFGTELIIENELPDIFKYKYIIIDEYQDISVARYNLIKAIRDKTGAKIMAVGDDWQSIYRFAGSDISLFTNFEKFFGTTYISKIENTYRNSQSLIDTAGDFVMQNSSQIKKNLKSNKNVDSPIQYIKIKGSKSGNTYNPLESLDQLFKKLNEYYYKENKVADIMILGRNNHDLQNIISNSKGFNSNNYKVIYKKDTGDKKIENLDFSNLNIWFTTVHKSKGLEADEVIIINNENDISGFPNLMVDNQILNCVLSIPEAYPHAEERRLFYVALTRTKNRCYLLYPIEPSVFLKELIYDHNITNYNNYEEKNDHVNSLLENQSCPKCTSGKLKLKNGMGKSFYGCNNYPYCDYVLGEKAINLIDEVIRCSKCGSFMVKRTGKRGSFYGCLNYPDCNFTLDIFESQSNEQDRKKKSQYEIEDEEDILV